MEKKIPPWTLNEQQICDLEMLLNGAFAPLQGFLNQTDYNSVLQTMRLSTGQLWPLPITLNARRKVHISTPIEECERRDRKGLYAKARAGLISHFTGINDPYEIPEQPELRLDTTDISPDVCAHQVLLKLKKLGFLKK